MQEQENNTQNKLEQYKKELQEFNSQGSNNKTYEPDLKKVEQLEVLNI